MSMSAVQFPSLQPQDKASASAQFRCKWVTNEYGRPVPFCLQNQNGPSALLVLFNVLLCREDLRLRQGTSHVSEYEAMSMIVEYASSYVPEIHETEQARVLRELSLHDLVDLLPSLARSANMNVRFNRPTAFEFTREVNALGAIPYLRLVHGWLVDPQDRQLSLSLGELSHKQVIEQMKRSDSLPTANMHHPPSAPGPAEPSSVPVSPPRVWEPYESPNVQSLPLSELDSMQFSFPLALRKSSPSPSGAESALNPTREPHTESNDDGKFPAHSIASIRKFFENYPGMLTYHGLAELHSSLHEEETAILFRSKNFFVLRKKAGQLYTLVTETVFADIAEIVWQRLGDIDGDAEYCDGAFRPVVQAYDKMYTPTQTYKEPASKANGSPVAVRDWPSFADARPCPLLSRKRANALSPASSSARSGQLRRSSESRTNPTRAPPCRSAKECRRNGGCSVQ